MNVLFKRGLSSSLANVVPPTDGSSGILYLTTDTDRLYVNKRQKLVNENGDDVLDTNGQSIYRSYIAPILATNPEKLTFYRDGKIQYEYDGSKPISIDLNPTFEHGDLNPTFEYGDLLPNTGSEKEGQLFFQLIDVENEWSIQDIELTGAVVGEGIYDNITKKVTISTSAALAPLTIKTNGQIRGVYDGSENKSIDIDLTSHVLKAGDEMTGPLRIIKIPEKGDSERIPALTLGRTDDINYLELDCNTIQAKTGNGLVQDLYLNEKGGKVHIGVEDLGDENQFIYLVDGVPIETTFSAGSEQQLIYMLNGKIKSSQKSIGNNNQFIFMQDGQFTASEFNAGSNIKGIYVQDGEIIESIATVGTNLQPVYFNNGEITASTATVGNNVTPIYMQNGNFNAFTANIGLTNKPIYMINGQLTESTATIGSNIQLIYMEDGEFKASENTIGANNKPIYLKDGVLTATEDSIGTDTQAIYMLNGELVPSIASIGNNRQPVYLNNGSIVASTASIGSNLQPIYLSNGLFMNSDANIGGEKQLMYMKNGTFTASITSVGTSTKPIYLNNGILTICNDTLDINISGNAATATVADSCEEAYFAQSSTTAVTAERWSKQRNINIIGSVSGTATIDGSSDITINVVSTDTDSEGRIQVYDTNLDYNYYITGVQGSGSQLLYRAFNNVGTENQVGVYFNGITGVLYGAAWNDYAEYRQTEEKIEPGRVIIENGDGTLSLSSKRMQPGAEIVSDTFGFAIGETNKCKTPIAASGRVLAYPNEDRNSYKPGDAVCAGPNGTVSKMTRREIKKYPERIIGVVSEIPNYEVWGQNNVKVNNRIWIRIK